VLDPIRFANHVKAHRSVIDGVAVPVQLCKLDAVANGCSNRWRNHWQICENGINLIERRLKLFLKKISGGAPVHLFDELNYGELNR
jgi:hypothetical protein